MANKHMTHEQPTEGRPSCHNFKKRLGDRVSKRARLRALWGLAEALGQEFPSLQPHSVPAVWEQCRVRAARLPEPVTTSLEERGEKKRDGCDYRHDRGDYLALKTSLRTGLINSKLDFCRELMFSFYGVRLLFLGCFFFCY